MEAFVSWSGGKETSLSCFRAMQSKNLKAVRLLNMISEDGTHSRSHGLGVNLLKLQAEAIDIPIVQRKSTWNAYEEEFKKALLDFKANGIEAGVFGDIDVEAHREWVERVCNNVGIKALLPLWKEEREKLMSEFIGLGFKAIVVATNREFLDKGWLGRAIDDKFVEDLKAQTTVDLCGENGEYHTFVYDGPIFKKPVEFVTGKKISKEKHCFLSLFPK